MEARYGNREGKDLATSTITRLIHFTLPALVPRRRRAEVVGDFRESVTSAREAVKEAADTLPIIIGQEIQTTFKWQLTLAQCCVLYLAFAGASPTLPPISIIPVLGAALTALVVRDAYSNPEAGSPREAVTDGLVTATFILGLQLFLAQIAPAWTLAIGVLIHGILVGLILMASLRSLFWENRRKSARSENASTTGTYQWTWKMYSMWIVACLADILTRPGKVDLREFGAMMMPLVAIWLVRWMRKQGAVSEDDEYRPLLQSYRVSITPKLNSSETLFFLLLLIPSASAIGNGINLVIYTATAAFCVYTLKYLPGTSS